MKLCTGKICHKIILVWALWVYYATFLLLLQACDRTDPCCNASTCLLKTWATCRTGPCCENCMARSSRSLCRGAQNPCDAPEFCDGFTGEVWSINLFCAVQHNGYIVYWNSMASQRSSFKVRQFNYYHIITQLHQSSLQPSVNPFINHLPIKLLPYQTPWHYKNHWSHGRHFIADWNSGSSIILADYDSFRLSDGVFTIIVIWTYNYFILHYII